MIVGQEKLLNKLNSYLAGTLPKTMMFIGESGCGKTMIIKYLAEKFNLELVNIDPAVTHDDLVDYSQNTKPTLYIINIKDFDEKHQNQFLKFIEEPAQSVYIAIEAQSESGILPTILNRCNKFYFEAYTPEQLKQVYPATLKTPEDLFFNIFKTPGQLINGNEKEVITVYNMCKAIIEKLDKANLANTLKLSLSINYKEDYNKIDFNLFLNTLEFVAFEDYKINNNIKSLKIYKITNQAKQDLINKVIIKENFMLNFLIKLWKGMH